MRQKIRKLCIGDLLPLIKNLVSFYRELLKKRDGAIDVASISFGILSLIFRTFYLRFLAVLLFPALRDF
jgi:hypothetical protein